MSILDISKNEKRELLPRVAGTLFCVVFAFVYNIFGHGVKSVHMDYMFLYPLIFGVVGYVVFLLTKWGRILSVLNSKVYNWGIVTLVFGNALKGVFDIAGTSSPYVVIYWIVGGVMIVSGMVSGLLYKRHN